jgi:hypothetical protein
MFKKCLSYVLMALLFIMSFSASLEAKTYSKNKSNKKQTRTSYSYTKKNKTKKKRTAKNARRTKSYRRSGNGPDLRALTTEKSDNEFTEVPDNGVNSVETKTGL